MSESRSANGHRRRQVRKRVLTEEDTCWICGDLVDKTLGKMPGIHSDRCTNPDCTGCVPDPMSPEVDEVIPVSEGGSPIDRTNCRLSHRVCNNGRNFIGRPTTLTPLETSRTW